MTAARREHGVGADLLGRRRHTVSRSSANRFTPIVSTRMIAVSTSAIVTP